MSKVKLIQLKYSNLEKLLIYRKLLNDHLFKEIYDLVMSIDTYIMEDYSLEPYFKICHKLINKIEEEKFEGDLLKNYILYLIATDENAFSKTCEREGININPGLFQATIHDMNIIKGILEFSLKDIGNVIGIEEINFVSNYVINNKSEKKNILQQRLDHLKYIFKQSRAEEIVNYLGKFYHKAGCGKLSRYNSFRWKKNKGLMEINNVDSITFSDLIGYEEQKEQLIENTEIFLEGKKGNNILLYGDSGTGKSSSVKALINKFYNQGLRLVEITQKQIKYIPEILEILQERGLYFIIFMDDLSFEDFETDYKYLKAVMEGGIEVKPDNVVFYATSNRRHLIKEKWDERNNVNEVHQSDALQEKLSLSERFGLTITYLTPDQDQYLKIVTELAKKNKIDIPEKVLIEKALKWEKWHHGRSGRTAKQFIDYLSGIHKK